MQSKPLPLSVITPPGAALLLQTAEMLTASAFVIQHRLWRMALAGPRPGARDRREFQKMGAEKLAATAEAGNAIVVRTMALAPKAASLLFDQWMRAATGMMTATAKPSAGLLGAQISLFQGSLATAQALAGHGLQAWIALAGQGLRPVHRRATANARRLGSVRM